MFRSIGWQELLIIVVILGLSWIPALGFYRIARRAGYETGAAVLWAIGFLFAGGLVTLVLGFIDWPRDRMPAFAPVPPPPPANGTL